MVYCGTRTVLLAVTASLNAVGIAVIDCHAIVRVSVTATDAQCVLLLETYLLHEVEEIFARAEIGSRITRRDTQVAVIFGIHHVEVAVGFVPR